MRQATMLTIRTAAHIPGNRHRRNFRSCATATGAPAKGDLGGCPLAEWKRLWNAEARRNWLDDRWSAHIQRVERRQKGKDQ